MKITLLAALLTIGLGSAFATTTDELMLSSGGLTATFQDNVSGCTGTGCGGLFGDINPVAGTASATGSLNGWSISISGGTSNSPGLTPFGIDVFSLVASCTGGGCLTSSLDLQFTDKNFNVATGANGFKTDYSATITGPGSTSQSAYFDNGNNPFAETTLIGTVGPFTGTNHGSAVGGAIAAVPNYSLTLDEVFTATSTGTSFTVSGDGNIVSGVPEPGALVLFGTVVVLTASKLRKRRAS